MSELPDLTSPTWWDSRYNEGSTPWDHGTVAPEVLAFAAEYPGKGGWAIDIGCGSGTHGRELARQGYRVVGIDLSHVAIRRALATARAEDLPWNGVQGSAADIMLFNRPFEVALDVGCFHGLSVEQQRQYASGLQCRLAKAGYYLLYAVHPRTSEDQEGPPGVDPAQIEAVFGPNFKCVWRSHGWQGERLADWWLWQA